MISRQLLYILIFAILVKCKIAGFTYPGTKWCGPGNSASNYSDLGRLRDQDKCCREHDHCPDNIKPFRSKHGLINKSLFTRSSCECDDKLRSCLRATGPRVSTIGYLYFTAIPKKCFKKAHPIIRCKKRGGFLKLKCVENELDYNAKMEYQWFDVPTFNSK